MPRKEIDYSKTLIYKIQHIDKDELIYVGHTTDFTKRKYSHKSNCTNEKHPLYNTKVYEMIRANGGWEMFKMIQIKEYYCKNKLEACAEEDKTMRQLKTTMNTNGATYDIEKHKNTQRVCNTVYKETHREELLEYWKSYRVKNINQINERTQEIVQCECGCFVTRKCKGTSRHIQSQKHQDGLKTFIQKIV
jgi:hypothetical protein